MPSQTHIRGGGVLDKEQGVSTEWSILKSCHQGNGCKFWYCHTCKEKKKMNLHYSKAAQKQWVEGVCKYKNNKLWISIFWQGKMTSSCLCWLPDNLNTLVFLQIKQTRYNVLVSEYGGHFLANNSKFTLQDWPDFPLIEIGKLGLANRHWIAMWELFKVQQSNNFKSHVLWPSHKFIVYCLWLHIYPTVISVVQYESSH